MKVLISGKADKVHYKRNIQIALIISLFISILLFIFFPHATGREADEYYFSEPIITLSDIPSTQQASAPSIPPKPVLLIPSELVEPEYSELPDVDFSIPENGYNKNKNNAPGKSKTYEFSSLPFIPRQVIEVVPKEIDGADGIIKLSLKIDHHGYVIEHKILVNSTNKDECLQNVIQAVYNSRWQPITIDGEKIEYWLEKSYQFN
ncbi:MAG: hypothetical protein R6W90_00025 [Ignavibacteriaceae bacterium]